MTCSKSAANALGLNKQDNINDTCAADLERIIIWLANNTVNKITEIMTCSKPTVNASGFTYLFIYSFFSPLISIIQLYNQ